MQGRFGEATRRRFFPHHRLLLVYGRRGGIEWPDPGDSDEPALEGDPCAAPGATLTLGLFPNALVQATGSPWRPAPPPRRPPPQHTPPLALDGVMRAVQAVPGGLPAPKRVWSASSASRWARATFAPTTSASLPLPPPSPATTTTAATTTRRRRRHAVLGGPASRRPV